MRLLTFILCVFLGAANAPAGEMYRFAIDRDRLSGPPACALNSPITAGDRIRVRNGHFYTVGKDGRANTGDDRRVRFWGINLGAPLTFPRTMAEAEKLATRLEKLGVNIVRLHSIDNSKDRPAYLTVFDTKAHYPVLNETNMKGLDRLLMAFRRHGIYAHFALHVSYTFDTRDTYRDEKGEHRIPDPAAVTDRYPEARPMPRGSEPLLMFNREMIELQKRFAAAILSRQNHLTGVPYKDDPVVASLELNNEDSLIEKFHLRKEVFPPLYAEELDRLWVKWLGVKYRTDHSLSLAWKFKGREEKPPGLANGTFDDATGGLPSGWSLQRFDDAWPPGAERQHKVNDWGTFKVTEAGALEVTVSKVPPTYWHIFVAQEGLHLKEGNVYKMRLKAWADTPRNIQISCQGGPNMSRMAFRKWKVAITTVPKFYEMTFASMMPADKCRLNILPLASDHPYKPGEDGGKLWLDDVSITWVKPYGLRPGESLRSQIARPVLSETRHEYPSPARRRDYLRFLRDTERDYYGEMKKFIREGIGAKQPVMGSQSNYGGFLGHQEMAELMDFVDRHSYYDHCSFPRAPNQAKWSYANVPMVEHPRSSVIGSITGACTEGKPFTITEYGPNPFNQYMIESYAIVPAYAAFQDIDAVFVFNYYRNYKDDRDKLDPERLDGAHSVLGDTRAEALMNLAATLFRRGLLKPSRGVIRIPIRGNQCLEQGYKGRNIRSLETWLEDSEEVRDKTGKGFDIRMGLISRIRIEHREERFQGRFPQLPAEEEDLRTGEKRSVYVSDTGELRWARYSKKKRSYFTLDTAQAKVVVGYLKREMHLAGVTITGTGEAGQFGLVSMISMDGRPVVKSSDILITSLGGRGRNRNLRVVEVDPVRKRYRLMGPNGVPAYYKGAGPFEIENNPVTIRLSSSAAALSVERLGPNGSGVAKEDVAKRKGQFTFTLGGTEERTPWYRVRNPKGR